MCADLYLRDREDVNNESHMYAYNGDAVQFRHFTQYLTVSDIFTFTIIDVQNVGQDQDFNFRNNVVRWLTSQSTNVNFCIFNYR